MKSIGSGLLELQQKIVAGKGLLKERLTENTPNDSDLPSCHVRVSGWIYTIGLPKCQETFCSKQAQYLTFKWQQQDSKPQTLSL